MRRATIPPFIYALISVMLLMASGTFSAHAGEFHKPPRDFLFGNHIDTHQETKL